MDRILERVAGQDVHKKTVTACVRVPGPRGTRRQEVRTFGTTVPELLALREWLGTHGATHVAMESTGVYWKPRPRGGRNVRPGQCRPHCPGPGP